LPFGHKHLQNDIADDQQDRQFNRGKLNGKEVERSPHGKAEGDSNPAVVAEDKDEQQKKTNPEKNSEGEWIAA